MTRNLGSWDRGLRGAVALLMGAAALAAPFSLALRLGVFGSMAVYLLWSSLAGTCLGYRLMGKSTCPVAGHP